MRRDYFGAVIAVLVFVTGMLWWRVVTVRAEVLQSCSDAAKLSQEAVHYAALKKRWESPEKSDRIIERMRAIAPYTIHRKGKRLQLSFEALTLMQLDRLTRQIYRQPLKLRTLTIRRGEHDRYSMKVEIER